jgi:hypothetical protein
MARRRKNPLIDELLWVVGAAVVGGGIWYLLTQGGTTVTLISDASGNGQQSVQVPLNSKVNVTLPSGAQWSAAIAAPGVPSSGSAPASFQYTGPTVSTYSWTDASNTLQTTTVSFSNA